MKFINIFLFFLLISLGVLFYLIYPNLPLETEEFRIIYKETLPDVENVSSELVQFVPNMRFATNEISYYFGEECSSEEINRMKQAFDIVSERVQVISFYQEFLDYNQAKINIICSEHDSEIHTHGRRETFIAGEGGPTRFLDLQPYSLIEQGEIKLYTYSNSRRCEKPIVEIHELLHVFGYDHVDDRNSVLYPYLSCNQELKDNIIQDLQRLYSQPAKAEIGIDNISASKSGRYLNFYIEVKNNGLIQAEQVELKIYSEDRLVETVEIQDITPGMMRSITMENLRLPSGRDGSVTFVVESSTPEYYLNNNRVQMVVQ